MLNLSLKVKVDPFIEESYRIVELFLKDWIDDNCNNQVKYIVDYQPSILPNSLFLEYTFNVEFDNSEDALAVKLKGIPERLQHYVQFAN